MIASRNKKGFTLGEVLIAVTIIGLVMTPIYVLEGRTYRAILNATHRLERFIIGTVFMTQTGIEKEKEPHSVVEKKSARPAMNMRYQMMEVPKESLLKDVKNLYLERVTLTWQEGKKKMEETIVMFHHRPEVKKE
jgi:prepilin-type N-terminal cleavage/methylation domain-containing protein